MTSVDMGMLAAAIEGFPAPAAAKAFAGPGSADATRPIPSAERKTAAGPSSFRAALRSAAADGPQGSAIMTAPSSTEEEPAQTGAKSVSTPDPRTAGAADIEAPEDGAPVKKEAIVWIEPPGMPWNGAVRIDVPAEACAASAAGQLPAGEEHHAADSKVGAEGLEPLDRLKALMAAASAEEAGRSRSASVQVLKALRTAGEMPLACDPETADVAPRQALAAVSPAKSEVATGGHEVRTETADGIGSSPAPAAAAPEKVGASSAAAPSEPVETPAVDRSVRIVRRATGVAQPAGRPAAAAADFAATSGAVADPLPMSGAAEAAAVHVLAPRMPHSSEAVNGHSAPEPFRPAETPPDRSDLAPEQRPADAQDPGDFGQAADDLISSKMNAGGKAAAMGKEAFPEALATLSRDAHPSAAAERILERAGDGSSAVHEKEAVGGSGRAGVFDQIVQRAAVHLKDNQGEIHIDLKPELLGRVRLQITAENQQVAVRIITELPTVRDLIETGLTQLKSELQSQGLQVERLEVAVADDHRRRDWQQAHSALGWKGGIGSAGPAADPDPAEQRYEPVYRRPRADGGKPSIDMFV